SAYVFDLDTGRGAGSIDLPAPVTAAAALGRRVVCVTENGRCLVIDPASARIVHETPGPFRPSIAIAEGKAFLSTEDGRSVHAFDESGQMNETAITGLSRPVANGPFAVAGQVVCTLDNGRLAVLHAGRLTIHSDTESEVMTGLSSRVYDVGGGEVLMQTKDNRLLRIDVTRGLIKHAYRPEIVAPMSATRHGSFIVLGLADAEGRIELYED
ncbi:MAG: hypothetical protein KDB53_04960, partial [Planctomycetes bacterium]|nr:hypothetical protein [Planctomycetota bacterium]